MLFRPRTIQLWALHISVAMSVRVSVYEMVSIACCDITIVVKVPFLFDEAVSPKASLVLVPN
jgi:hypothetical protein